MNVCTCMYAYVYMSMYIYMYVHICVRQNSYSLYQHNPYYILTKVAFNKCKSIKILILSR